MVGGGTEERGINKEKGKENMKEEESRGKDLLSQCLGFSE